MEDVRDSLKLARWHRNKGEYAQAMAELQKAKSLDPANEEIRQEIEITQKALAADIDDSLKLARWHRDRGEYQAAIAELEKAKALDPANEQVRQEMEITQKAWDAEQKLG